MKRLTKTQWNAAGVHNPYNMRRYSHGRRGKRKEPRDERSGDVRPLRVQAMRGPEMITLAAGWSGPVRRRATRFIHGGSALSHGRAAPPAPAMPEIRAGTRRPTRATLTSSGISGTRLPGDRKE